MKVYRDIETGEILYTLPKIYKNTSPITDENLHLVGLECIIKEDPIIEDGGTSETSCVCCDQLDTACELFRAICETIKTTLTLEDFKGGFDEILALTSEQIATLKTTDLLERLTFIDRLCNHEANKVGLPAPLWWHRCWQTLNQEPPIEPPTE